MQLHEKLFLAGLALGVLAVLFAIADGVRRAWAIRASRTEMEYHRKVLQRNMRLLILAACAAETWEEESMLRSALRVNLEAYRGI